MDKLTSSMPNRILSAGLGKLVGKRTSEALIMTRISSAFNFLKRVGFAVLLLGGMCGASRADTTWVSGQVGGVWDMSGSPYIIIDTTFVDETIGLEVTPGVEVSFPEPDSRLWLAGNCTFAGALDDSIIIRIDNVDSQLRSNTPSLGFVRMDYCNVFSRGDISLICDSVILANTSFSTEEGSLSYIFVSANRLVLLDSRVTFVWAECLSTTIHNVTLRDGIIARNGSLVVDSLYSVSADPTNASVLSVRPAGLDKEIEISNSQVGTISIDGANAPNCLAMLTNVSTTSRLGNSLLVEFIPEFLAQECAMQRVRLEWCGGTIERSSLYSLALEVNTNDIIVRKNVFSIHEDCAECYPNGFVTGTVEHDLQMYNNVFDSGNSHLRVVYSPTAINVDASYNITVGMDDPWQGVIEGLGNFDADSLFDPHSNSFSLRYGSPAIDSGQPGFPDEDGSRSDIGIDWWDHRFDHPPIITTPDTLEARWGEHFTFVLSAVDEGPVTFPFVPIGPLWLTGARHLDEQRDTLFSGTVPYGVSSFDIILGAKDHIDQTDRETVHVEVYPQSVLLDTVKGVLTVDYSPYRFFRDILIPVLDSLLVQPGVAIEADCVSCSPRILVQGKLDAVGSETDSILFRSLTGTSWNGISGDSGSIIDLQFVSFADAYDAIFAQASNAVSISNVTMGGEFVETPSNLYVIDVAQPVRVSDCDFWNGSRLTLSESEFTLEDSRFLGGGQQHSSGTVLVNNCEGTIERCEFARLPTQAIQIQGSQPIVERCTFKDIDASRVIVSSTWGYEGPTIQHNTFVGMGSQSAIGFVPNSSIVIRNNVFSDFNHVLRSNVSGIDTNDVVIQNNCFWNVQSVTNQDSFYWPTLGTLVDINSNGDSIDIFSNLVDNPEIADSTFLLLPNSPCIDAGAEFGQIFVGMAPDIGCFEYDPTTRWDDPTVAPINPENCTLLVLPYPNPTNATISFLLSPEFHPSIIRVYNLLGQIVFMKRIERQNQSSINSTIHITVSDWPSGSYYAVFGSIDLIQISQFTVLR